MKNVSCTNRVLVGPMYDHGSLKCYVYEGTFVVKSRYIIIIVIVSYEGNMQVGMPVLGVVENMSGLQQGLASFRFLLPGPDGAAQDVSAEVLKAVQASLPDSQVSCCDIAIGAICFHSSPGRVHPLIGKQASPIYFNVLIFFLCNRLCRQRLVPGNSLRTPSIGCSSKLGAAPASEPQVFLSCQSQRQSWRLGAGYLLHGISLEEARRLQGICLQE